MLEYIAVEILELSGNQAGDSSSTQILPRHIALAITSDSELDIAFPGIDLGAMRDGGVMFAPPCKQHRPTDFEEWLMLQSKNRPVVDPRSGCHVLAKGDELIPVPELDAVTSDTQAERQAAARKVLTPETRQLLINSATSEEARVARVHKLGAISQNHTQLTILPKIFAFLVVKEMVSGTRLMKWTPEGLKAFQCGTEHFMLKFLDQCKHAAGRHGRRVVEVADLETSWDGLGRDLGRDAWCSAATDLFPFKKASELAKFRIQSHAIAEVDQSHTDPVLLNTQYQDLCSRRCKCREVIHGALSAIATLGETLCATSCAFVGNETVQAQCVETLDEFSALQMKIREMAISESHDSGSALEAAIESRNAFRLDMLQKLRTALDAHDTASLAARVTWLQMQVSALESALSVLDTVKQHRIQPKLTNPQDALHILEKWKEETASDPYIDATEKSIAQARRVLQATTLFAPEGIPAVVSDFRTVMSAAAQAILAEHRFWDIDPWGTFPVQEVLCAGQHVLQDRKAEHSSLTSLSDRLLRYKEQIARTEAAERGIRERAVHDLDKASEGELDAREALEDAQIKLKRALDRHKLSGKRARLDELQTDVSEVSVQTY